jgi:hypothetical protein
VLGSPPVQKKFPLVTVLWAALAVLLLVHAYFSQYNHDEIEHLHSAWLMSIGQLPFRDFLEQHHPTIWLLFQPLVRMTQRPHALIFGARLFDLGVLFAFCLTLHKLVKRFVPEGAPWAVLLVLASFTFTRNMILFRPDPLMNLFLYMGILQWVIFLQEERLARAAAAGLFFGLSIAVLQKSIAMIGLVGVASLIVVVRRRKLIPGALAALVSAALPILILFAWVRARGIWPEFWFWNYEFNRFFYTKATLSVQFTVTGNLERSIYEDPALWAFGAVGVGRWIKRGIDDARLVLLIAMVGYFISLGFNKFPFEQYFIVVLPLWAPFAAELFRSPPIYLRVIAAGMLLILLGIGIDVSSNRTQRGLHEYILDHSSGEQTIYVSPPINPIVRQDATFFWYNGELIGDACAKYEALHPGAIDPRLLQDARWRERPPSLVYLDPKNPTYHPYRWRERAIDFVPSPAADLFLRR